MYSKSPTYKPSTFNFQNGNVCATPCMAAVVLFKVRCCNFGLPWWLNSKESTCNAENTGDTASVPGSGGSPGGGHRTHSSALAWRIPWTKNPGGLQSAGPQRVGHDWSDSAQTLTHALLIIANCVSWGPRLTLLNLWKKSLLMNTFLEQNSLVCKWAGFEK